jgi:hypothetical protein
MQRAIKRRGKMGLRYDPEQVSVPYDKGVLKNHRKFLGSGGTRHPHPEGNKQQQ